MLTIIGAIVMAHLAYSSQLHPLYRTGNNLTRHALWTEMYYGLQSHPDWIKKYGPTHQINGVPATGDMVPMAAARNYLEKNAVADRSKVFDPVGNMYWGAIDHYSMLALFDFVRSDPRFVWECFEFKLTGMWHVIIASTKWVIGTASVLTLVLLSFFIAFAAFLVAIASMQERRAFRVLLMFIAFCVPASWLPNLVGFVGWEVAADGIFAWLFFLFGFLAYVLGVVLQYLVVPIFRKSAAADRVAPLTQ